MSARENGILHAVALAALLFALPSAQAQKHGRGFPEIPNLHPGLSHKLGGPYPGHGFGPPGKNHAGIGSSGPGKAGPLAIGPGNSSPFDQGNLLGKGPPSFTDRGSSGSDKGSSDRGNSHSDKGAHSADRGSFASGRGGSGGSSDKDSPDENLQTASSENSSTGSKRLHVIPTCR